MKTKVVGTIIIILILAGLGAAFQLRLFNRSPKAEFSYRASIRTLKYINPNSDDIILFVNTSSDPDGDPLSYSWRIDGKEVNKSRDHWASFSAGNHTVKLVVSDGKAESSMEKKLAVEPSQIYPKREFPFTIKGIVYHAGRHFTGYYGTPPPEDEMVECLAVIRNELGCNGISIVGSYDDVTIKCAEIAVDMKFQMIVIDPFYQRSAPNNRTHINDFVERIIALSGKAEEVRKRSPESVVMSVGNELTNRYVGVTYENINQYLRKIVEGVRARFHGKIAYLSAGQEAEKFKVDWSGLGIDIVEPHLYYAKKYLDAPRVLYQIDRLSIPGKLLVSSEFGCQTFKGASLYGGDGDAFEGVKVYDPEEQAQNIIETLELYRQRPNLKGAFLYVFMQYFMPQEKARAMGIMEHSGPGLPNTRKLGFYAYKSYVLVNLSSTAKSESGANLAVSSLPFAFNRLTGVTVPATSVQILGHKKQNEVTQETMF